MMYKSNHYAVLLSLYSAAYQLHFFKTGWKYHNTKKKKKTSWLYVEPVLAFSLWKCVDYLKTWFYKNSSEYLIRVYFFGL